MCILCGDDPKEETPTDTSDEKKYGKKKEYDPMFKGPIRNRSCTDVICCILFLVCTLGALACSIAGYARGDPIKLLYPTDSSGNICGYGSYTSKPYLVFFDLLQCAKMGTGVVVYGCPTPQVCVSTCPSTYYVYLETLALETANGGMLTAERNKMLCKEGVDPTATASVQTLIDDYDCASYYVESTSIIGRCIPAIFDQITDYATSLLTSGGYTLQSADGVNVTGTNLESGTYYLALFYQVYNFGELLYKDIVAAWWLILVFLGIGMVVAFIWIVLLRWLAGVLVWVTIFLVFGVMIYVTASCYVKYYELKNTNQTATLGLSAAFQWNFQYYLSLKETWLAFACSAATLTSILILLVLCLCGRICIAIELIKEGSKAIGNMIFTLFWPIIPFVLELAVIAYWVVSAVYVASMGEASFYTNDTVTDTVNNLLSRTPCSSSNETIAGSICEFVKYGGTEYIIFMQFYLLFMFLWLINFIFALGQMVLAGSFASYYWAFDKSKDIPAFPLAASVWRSLRYHTGSLAFGSLIIAIIQMIRIFLEYLDAKLKGSENPVAKFFLKCLKCVFWCLEKFMKFLNKNAYIMIAIHGKNFCLSAKDAFFLIIRNVVRAVVVDKTTDFVMFLSKLLVTASVACAAYYWFQGSIPFFTNYVPSLNYYWTPVIILIVGVYIISACFFSVYNMGVYTLFLCFLEDLERNDGSAEKPYYMSKGLMKVLGKKNKKLEDPDEDKEEGKKSAKGKK